MLEFKSIVTRSGRLLVAPAGEDNMSKLSSRPPPGRDNYPAGDISLVTGIDNEERNPGLSGIQENSEGGEARDKSSVKDKTSCKDCGMHFPSLRSLGMHQHHRHPVELNEERIMLLQKKRKFWMVEEDLLLYEVADL